MGKLDTVEVNGPEGDVVDWDAVDWRRVDDDVRRLRHRILGDAGGTCLTRACLSPVRRNGARRVLRGRRRSNAPPLPDYWAVDVLQAHGAQVHLAHPLGVKGFRYRRVKNDVRDAGDLADLLRMGRLPEAWIAPPQTRELRELVRYRAKLVAMRSGLKAQVHAVLAKAGVLIAVSDLFGVAGRQRLARVPLARAYAERVRSLLELIDILDGHEARFAAMIAERLGAHRGYQAIQQLHGVGPVLAAVFVAEIGDVHRFAEPAQLCSWAGLTPTPPRIGHRRSPRAHHQTGQQTRAVGGRGGHPTPAGHHQDRPRSPTDRGPPRPQHRQDRRGPQTAHTGLLRPARRTHPCPGPRGRVSISDATRARSLNCLTPESSAWSPF